MNVSVKVGRRIRYARTSKHIYQADLAVAADLSRVQLSRIENGRSDPSIGTLARIAHALNTSISDLLKDI